MSTYAVKISATVTKTYLVAAPDADKATELAHEVFTVECTTGEECYTQDTVDVREVDGSVEPDAVWDDDVDESPTF